MEDELYQSYFGEYNEEEINFYTDGGYKIYKETPIAASAVYN